MFYVYFNEGKANVFDTDDFSCETCPESDVRSFLSSSGYSCYVFDTPFKVIKDGEYALAYTVLGGRHHEAKAFLHKQGMVAMKSMSVRGVGDISVRMKTYPLGCTVYFQTMRGQRKYQCLQKYNQDLSLVDSVSWTPVTR